MTTTHLNSFHLNSFWCEILVEELVRNGITYCCLSPGSRSTPLALAFARHPRITTIVCFDERGAAFHALGYARATGKAAVLVCTSGTAVANYFPAVVEASMDAVPMLILSADRPPELLETGANQTIRQHGIFGSYPRWFVELPCPDTAIPPQMLLTTLNYALHKAQHPPQGVVHINCMFREPLAPPLLHTPEDEMRFTIPAEYTTQISAWQTSEQPYTSYHEPLRVLTQTQAEEICVRLRTARLPMLIVGELRTAAEREAVLAFAHTVTNAPDIAFMPLVADILSGIRTKPHEKSEIDTIEHLLLPYFDQQLLSAKHRAEFAPDLLLHIGGRITSKRCLQWIEQGCSVITLQSHHARYDPAHTASLRFEGSIAESCAALQHCLEQTQNTKHPATNNQTTKQPSNQVTKQPNNQHFTDRIEEFLVKTSVVSEIGVAHAITRYIPQIHGLFLGNSMPIRDADMYAVPFQGTEHIAANRGASGIDGIIASAAGFAQGLNAPVTLLIGDVSFLHDMSSLSLLRSVQQPLTIVVVNNSGGGIFSFLPIAQNSATESTIVEKIFGTPHEYTFSHAAALFGLEYACPATHEEFVQVYTRVCTTATRHTLIEVRTERERNYAEHKALQAALVKVLEGAS